MHQEIEERLRDLARRAGLGGVPPAVVAAGLVAAGLAVAWAGWHWWPREDAKVSKGSAESIAKPGAVSVAATAASEATSSMVIVHVVGAVRRPGVYELMPDARVADAIDAAGGALSNAAPAAVNLARSVADGEQIVVPTKDEVAAGKGAGAAAGGAPAPGGVPGAASAPAGQPVNINTADAAALDTLPGVGPSTAEKIVADREANGPFASPDDLGRVSGIGPKKLEQLKGLVCVR